MFSLFILFLIITFEAEARGPDNEPVEITFKLHAEVKKSGVHIICDHLDKFRNYYTVLEEETFRIHTQYDSYIHHLICKDKSQENVFNSYMEKSGSKDIITFKAEKRMAGVWNCTVLLHQDHPSTFPKVQYKDANYTAAYCYMFIHVRLLESPQTILVNNMALETVRTDLSEIVDFTAFSSRLVDFTAEYQYADGDVVNVTCVDFLNPDDALLEMEYSMAKTMSDGPSNMLPYYRVVGFIARLHSDHNNSYMICYNHNQDSNDHTDVMVRFVMRTEFSAISVTINGMTVRPRVDFENYYTSSIDYKCESLHPINVVCDVQQADMRLEVKDPWNLDVNSYTKTAKKAEMSFYINVTDYVSLDCAASNYITGAVAETIMFSFSGVNFPLNEYSLHITSSNGRSMDSYGQHRLIYYEYNDGETLQIQCGPLLNLSATSYNNLSLHLGDSDECRTHGCVLSKRFNVSRRDHDIKIVCYLKGANKIEPLWGIDKLSEIRVILRARVLTTTSTTSTSPVTALTAVTTTTSTAADPASSTTSSSNTLVYWLSGVGVGAVIITLITVFFIHKKRCWCLRSPELAPTPVPRPDPATRYYENLLAIFRPINEREAMELEENHYEVVE